MATEYSKNTIINIYTDEVINYEGDYSRQSGNLVIGSNSWVSFGKDIDAEENRIKTDLLRLALDVTSSDNTITSRYNSKIKINLKIQYYAEVSNDDGTVSYVAGLCETICVTPYLSSETDGKISEYHINTKSMPIKSIEIYIYNNNESQNIGIYNFGIYNSLSTTESLGDSLAIECTLTGVEKWRTGLRIKFTNGDLDLKALKSSDTGKFAGYNVNDKAVITWSEVNADL